MEIWQGMKEDGGWLNFPLLVSGKQVAMRISTEALIDHFGAGKMGVSIISTYRKHALVIDQKALERHLADPFSKVLLKSSDF